MCRLVGIRQLLYERTGTFPRLPHLPEEHAVTVAMQCNRELFATVRRNRELTPLATVLPFKPPNGDGR